MRPGPACTGHIFRRMTAVVRLRGGSGRSCLAVHMQQLHLPLPRLMPTLSTCKPKANASGGSGWRRRKKKKKKVDQREVSIARATGRQSSALSHQDLSLPTPYIWHNTALYSSHEQGIHSLTSDPHLAAQFVWPSGQSLPNHIFNQMTHQHPPSDYDT